MVATALTTLDVRRLLARQSLRSLAKSTGVCRKILRRLAAGGTSTYTPGRGRKPLSVETVQSIERRLERGEQRGAIASHEGCSESTVSHINSGQYRPGENKRGAKLRPDEVFLDPPQRCPQGHLCSVLPCRTCVARERLAKFRFILARCQAAVKKTRAPRKKQRGAQRLENPNAFDLAPRQQAALDEIRREAGRRGS